MNAHVLKTLLSSALGTLILAHTITGMPMAGTPAQPSTSMPTAAPTAPTTGPQMPAATATAAPISAPVQQPASPSTTQLKEVQEALSGMEEAKIALSKLLTDLDAKLLDARKQAAEAKTLSFSLLEKQQESEAKADYEKIRAANKIVQEAQQFAQTEFTKGFNDKIAELRVKSAQADAALKAINTQKAALEASKKIATPQPLQTPPAASGATKEESQKPRERVVASPGITDSIASGIATVFGSIKGLFGSRDTGAKKKTVINQNLPPAPTDPALRAREATAMVQQMDKNLQSLDATRTTIQQHLATINQSSQYIENLAKQSNEGSSLLKQSKKDAIKPVESVWKKTILRYTGKILDGIGLMASNIYELYDATIGTFMRRLIKDVKRKIATQESLNATAAA